MTEQLHLVKVAEQKIITPRSKYQRWKWEHKYKKAEKNSSVRCKNCKHLFANMPNCTGGGKYYKCELLGRSSSSATDIRLSYVCNRFEEYMEK